MSTLPILRKSGARWYEDKLLFLDLEMDDIGVFIAALQVIDRHRKALRLRILRCDGGKQIRRERGDAAFARQVSAKKRDLSNLG